MGFIWIRSRHSNGDDDSLIVPEALVLQALSKEGQCSMYTLDRKYAIHPQQIVRAIRKLRKRGWIHQSEVRLTEEGERIAEQLRKYLPIQSKNYERVQLSANGQVGTWMLNVGGGEAEFARVVDGKIYPIQMGFKGSITIPPRETLFARTEKGTPFFIMSAEG
jgi:DNA-binding MarR family transcriptional regulator